MLATLCAAYFLNSFLSWILEPAKLEEAWTSGRALLEAAETHIDSVDKSIAVAFEKYPKLTQRYQDTKKIVARRLASFNHGRFSVGEERATIEPCTYELERPSHAGSPYRSLFYRSKSRPRIHKITITLPRAQNASTVHNATSAEIPSPDQPDGLEDVFWLLIFFICIVAPCSLRIFNHIRSRRTHVFNAILPTSSPPVSPLARAEAKSETGPEASAEPSVIPSYVSSIQPFDTWTCETLSGHQHILLTPAITVTVPSSTSESFSSNASLPRPQKSKRHVRDKVRKRDKHAKWDAEEELDFYSRPIEVEDTDWDRRRIGRLD